MKITPILCAIVCAQPALADLTVDFIEGAPKDRFVITHNDGCPVADAQITIDLQGSQGALVFDTAAGAQGVEVFQPFEVVAGAALLTDLPRVADGDRSITLNTGAIPVGGQIAFTIDVDDTLGQREITVTGAEIAGATVSMTNGATISIAQFDARAKAVIVGTVCQS